MPPTTSVPAAPRKNRGPAAAAENRQALIAAAREVYAEGGLNAPFSAVAKRAGVGQGSLYRHFPDRTALAVAVFEDNVRDLEEYTAPEDRTVDDLLDRVVDQAVASTALIELITADLTADLTDPRTARLAERFTALVATLVERDRASGRIGDHIDVTDVALASSMLATELARAEPAMRPEIARRVLALFRAAFAPR